MAFTFDATLLAKLKRQLTIDSGDTDRDTDLTNLAGDVQTIIQDAIGPFDATTKTWELEGTNTSKIQFKRLRTFRSVASITITDQDGSTSGAVDSSTYVVYEDKENDLVEVERRNDYDADSVTITAPDDGVSFPTFTYKQFPVTLVINVGWNDASESLPTWLQNDWVMFTRKYYQDVVGHEDMVFEENKSKKVRMSEDDFFFHVRDYYDSIEIAGH